MFVSHMTEIRENLAPSERVKIDEDMVRIRRNIGRYPSNCLRKWLKLNPVKIDSIMTKAGLKILLLLLSCKTWALTVPNSVEEGERRGKIDWLSKLKTGIAEAT